MKIITRLKYKLPNVIVCVQDASIYVSLCSNHQSIRAQGLKRSSQGQHHESRLKAKFEVNRKFLNIHQTDSNPIRFQSLSATLLRGPVPSHLYLYLKTNKTKTRAKSLSSIYLSSSARLDQSLSVVQGDVSTSTQGFMPIHKTGVLSLGCPWLQCPGAPAIWLELPDSGEDTSFD